MVPALRERKRSITRAQESIKRRQRYSDGIDGLYVSRRSRRRRPRDADADRQGRGVGDDLRESGAGEGGESIGGQQVKEGLGIVGT